MCAYSTRCTNSILFHIKYLYNWSLDFGLPGVLSPGPNTLTRICLLLPTVFKPRQGDKCCYVPGD